MKYMLLLTNTDEQLEEWKTMSPEEGAAARAQEMPKWIALFEELGPYHRGGAELEAPWDAKTVRVRDGERLVTDGPFAETKEQVGGYFLLETDDLDRAIALAARIPVAERGSVEIRPVL
jgi:hypothetical protein